MKRLFVFAIGGTGSRVLKSLIMLLASGVKTNGCEIVPIIIDPHLDNGDVQRTQGMITSYRKIREANGKKSDVFFGTEISTLNDIQKNDTGVNLNIMFVNKNEVSVSKFGDYIGYNESKIDVQMSDDLKYLSEILFSGKSIADGGKKIDSLLDVNMDIGFVGNPNIGSVVLNQITKELGYENFLNAAKNSDDLGIFIISSIFGGTGAAGFPVLLKNIIKDSKDIPSLKKAQIGAITVMPYFSLEPKEDSPIKSDDFIDKTKSALYYYRNNLSKDIDSLYYIGDRLKIEIPNDPGYGKQKNDAPFIELASALAIIDFIENPTAKEEDGSKKTSFKEFKIDSPVAANSGNSINFTSLEDDSRKQIEMPLSQFEMFRKFWDNEWNSSIARDPWAKDNEPKIDENYKKSPIGKELAEFFGYFEDWLNELKKNKVSFAPFNLDSDLKNLINGKEAKKLGILFGKTLDFDYFAKELNEESKPSKGIDGITQDKKIFDLFFKTTEKLVKLYEEKKDNGNDSSAKDYIFRLENNVEEIGQAKNDGWFKSKEYDKKDIASIKPPQENSSAEYAPCAVPSPFARIDLFKTAFQKANDGKANKTDERLISECFDLAELLFNYSSIKEKYKLEIVTVKCKFKEYGKTGAKCNKLIDALDIYWEQDKKTYHFNLTDTLYLIKSRKKVIGGTSPSTLFFSSADPDIPEIKIGDRQLFSKDFCPLWKRNEDFLIFLYSWYEHFKNTELSELQELKDYLNFSKKKLKEQNQDLSDKINDISGNLSNYEMININDGISLDVINKVSFYKNKSTANADYAKDSDFGIKSEKIAEDIQIPLVFSANPNKNWRYLKTNWNESFGNPNNSESVKIEDRILPGYGDKYPFLLASDFLEENLIKVPYKINSAYWTGNNNFQASNVGVLLPLKAKFFEYFSPDDLIKKTNGLEISFESSNEGKSITTLLKIPAKKGLIELKRDYAEKKSDLCGKVIEAAFAFNIFPFIKLPPSDSESQYRTHLIFDKDKLVTKLKFYDSNFKEIKPKSEYERYKEQSQIYEMQNCFDIVGVEVANSYARGVALPKWIESKKGIGVFTFAVDLGTSNTHIEYRVDKNTPKPFSIQVKNDGITFTAPFCEQSDELDSGENLGFGIKGNFYNHSKREFLWRKLENAFPMKTVIVKEKNTGNDYQCLLNCNIPFEMEKLGLSVDEKQESDIKWSEDKEQATEKRLKEYIRELFLLMKSLVLLEGGSLIDTKLIWFYPSSMKRPHINEFKEIWENFFKKYFMGKEDNLKYIPESLSPFYGAKIEIMRQGGSDRPSITIDIGGGTTDIAIMETGLKPKPILMTSFRFAGNALFGDGYAHNSKMRNGLVLKYAKFFFEKFEKGIDFDLRRNQEIKHKEGKRIDEYLYDNDFNAADMSGYYFSLEKIYGEEFSYNKQLKKDGDFKLLFIYFYSAIIYHIAQIIKNKNCRVPKSLVFSGTASKILDIIGEKGDLEVISNKIFEFVLQRKLSGAQENLTVIKTPNPKEVTCKGGLEVWESEESKELTLEKISPTIKSFAFKQNDGKYIEVKCSDIEQNINGIKIEIVNEIKSFNNFFIRLYYDYIKGNFKVSDGAIEVFKIKMNENLDSNLIAGLGHNGWNKKEVENDSINDSIFFYPLVQSILNISFDLCDIKKFLAQNQRE